MYYYSESKRQWVPVRKMHENHLRNAIRKNLDTSQCVLFDELMKRHDAAAEKSRSKSVKRLPPGTYRLVVDE